MAKLTLKFEQAFVKEHKLTRETLRIGRLADNDVQLDHLAVSGHHAKVSWDRDRYHIEDLNSLNGTWVNGERIGRAALRDGDKIIIGKHLIEFTDDGTALNRPVVQAESVPVTATQPILTQPDRTAPAPPATAAGAGDGPELVGVLTVLEGKTEQPEYVLDDVLNVIGKSDMASIKLSGWFAPKVAAVIHRKDRKYYVSPSEKTIQVRVNGEEISGKRELTDGDKLEVSKVQMSFALRR